MAMSENSKKVFNFVKENDGTNYTAQDIANYTGLNVKSVNGIVTAAFQRYTVKDEDGNKVPMPLMERIPAEVELPDGSHKPVKFIRLTEAGKAFNPDAE